MDYDKLQDIWDRHKVYDYFESKYLTDIENEFDWDNIHKELDLKKPEALLNEYEVGKFEDSPIYCCFVGTVFNMSPSGKYYMPWACSNVTIKEALKDEIWNECLNEILENHGLFGVNGEGDPCDIFFCKEIEKREE